MCQATRFESRCRCLNVEKLARKIIDRTGRTYGFIDSALDAFKRDGHFLPGFAARIEFLAAQKGAFEDDGTPNHDNGGNPISGGTGAEDIKAGDEPAESSSDTFDEDSERRE